jgi:subtilisin family serine protease
MKRNCLLALGLALVVAGCGDNAGPTDTNGSPDLASSSLNGTIRINVVLKAPATAANRAELKRYGSIYDEIPQLNAVLMKGKAEGLAAIRALPFVKGASPDAERGTGPVVGAEADPLAIGDGNNVWNLDAINVTDFGGTTRTVAQDGSGVYVAVLDSGLLPFWRFYFNGKNVATQYARSFGGGGEGGENVSEQPNKWEQDVDAHGTHVSSIILGFQYFAASTGGIFPVNGVAPAATLIPVKVLNQSGGGWTAPIAHAIVYIADLFNPGGGELGSRGPLGDKRVVINMSLGGSQLDVLEQESIDYAIARNVVVVAAGGNGGPDGAMIYPGAYAPVISVAAAGWIGEWDDPADNCEALDNGADALLATRWWRQCDVPETYSQNDFYIADFSSEPDPDADGGPQDLDVAAPGSWVVGPYQEQQGKISYFFVGGTSQATPHVTGIVALLLQRDASLTPAQIESCLEAAAETHPLADVGQTVRDGPGLSPADPSDWTTDGRQGHGFLTADAALEACS